jgi:hypothetical protein
MATTRRPKYLPGVRGTFPVVIGLLTATYARAEKVKILVMDVQCSQNVEPDVAGAMTGVVAATLDEPGAFQTITTRDVQEMLEVEKAKRVAGCESDLACLAEIGGALGAELLVTGRVTLLGSKHLIQFDLLRVSPPEVVKRVERQYAGSSAGLLDDLRIAIRLLVRDVLAGRSGTLLVRASEEGSTIRVDGTIVGVSPLDLPITLAEGTHTVDVEREGFVVFRKDVAVRPGEGMFLDAKLRPSQAFIESYEASAMAQRIGAWSAIGAGIAAVGTGVALFFVGSSKASALRDDIDAYNALPQEQRSRESFADLDDREKSLGTIDAFTLVTGIIGVAAIATGSVLLFTGSDPDRYTVSSGVASLAL